MEVNEDFGAQREGCFCCGKRLGPRQLARHLRDYLADFDAELSAAADLGDGRDGDNHRALNNADPAPHDDGSGGGDVAMEDGAGNAQDFAQEDGEVLNDMNLGLENGPPLPPPPPPPSPVRPPDPEPIRVHEPRRNPPVTIEDWPEPGSDHESEGDFDNEPVYGPDQDPPYVEQPAQPVEGQLNPHVELDLTDEQVRMALEVQLGDLADEEWMDMYNRVLSKKDENTLRLLATRIRTHFSRQTYNELRLGICEGLAIPSEFIALRRLRILAGLEVQSYDCCLNSCCCFLGKYENCDACPFCKEPRYNAAGNARRSFRYTPLIPQLRALFRDPEMVDKLGYRATADAQRDPHLIQDVFDGENYLELRNQKLDPGGEYQFFDNPEDLALFLSTDGFTLFKRRRRGLSTAWPIILINGNLHGRYRTRLENVICVGVIPGPRQCKDINSFLVPLLEELLLLERGVDAIKVPPVNVVGGQAVRFVLRAFLIMIFGDIPAVSKLLAMKGHNAKMPCRACYLQGILCRLPRNSVYYIPLTRPGDRMGLPPELLLMRTQELFRFHYDVLDAQSAHPTRRAKLAQEYGINGRPIFERLKSFDLSTCAPYDIMHLIFENLVPNMILHWTGKFKHLDQGTGNYQLDEEVWKTIGKLSHEAAATIPSAFVGTLPDIAQDRNLYKAEAYSFWIQYIGPIVLKGRLPERYYRHYLLMREIIIYTVQIDIRKVDIDRLERMIHRWVNQYE
ncbi:hypothetical protein FRC06_011374, partial [Ceratobasidium sp. 370]